jgi:hypothetical protein
MENRIQINGTWYIKEDTIDTQPEKPSFNIESVTHFEGCVYETDRYCWEATRIYKTNSKEFHDGVSIEFTNKITKEVEYWDNDGWMKNVLRNNEEAVEMARESMNDDGIATFRLFISFLMWRGWLK